MTQENFNQIAYAQQTKEAIITLLKISTPEIEEPVLICDTPVQKFSELGENIYGVMSNGERYLFLPFTITLPRDDDSGVVTSKIEIDNIDRNIVRYARETKQALDVDVKIVTTADLDFEEFGFNFFKLKGVSFDGFKVTGTLSIDYLGLEPVPSGRFTPSGFPGLF